MCTRAAERLCGCQALRGPSFLLPDARQQRGCCSDFRTSPEPCPATDAERTMDVPQSISHLHHPKEAAFSSPGRSPLRISSLSGGHLRSLWAEWWPKSGACPTAKTRAQAEKQRGSGASDSLPLPALPSTWEKPASQVTSPTPHTAASPSLPTQHPLPPGQLRMQPGGLCSPHHANSR